MRHPSKVNLSLSRKPEEEEVEGVFFVSIILAIPFIIVVFVLLAPNLLPLTSKYGVSIPLYGMICPWFLIHAVISIVMALRSKLSSDQFWMLAKLILFLNIGFPFLFAGILTLNEYVLLSLIGRITDYARLLYASIFLIAVFEVFCILYVGKKLFGERIRRWYHLKPISDVGVQRRAAKYLSDAEKRLKKGEFEGASEMYHSAAQMYLSVDDWGKAANNHWLAAETLAKDSADMRFGVALLYMLSAAAHFLGNDIEKVEEAMNRTKEIVRDYKVDKRGEIAVALEILEGIKAGDLQLLQKESAKAVRSVKNMFGPYGEEMALLLTKNLERIQQRT